MAIYLSAGGALQATTTTPQHQQAAMPSNAASSTLDIRPEGFANPLAKHPGGLIGRVIFEAICPDFMVSQALLCKIVRLVNSRWGHTYPEEVGLLERWELAERVWDTLSWRLAMENSLTSVLLQDMDLPERWGDPATLIGKTLIPRLELQGLFTEVIQKIEEEKTTLDLFRIPQSEKDRVWDALAPERLQILKKTMVASLSTAFAENFSGKDIDAMLTKYRQNVVLEDYHVKLSEVVGDNEGSMMEAMSAAIEGMREDLSREVMAALGLEN